MKITTNVTVLDAVSISWQEDACIVARTLEQGIRYWVLYIELLKKKHDKSCLSIHRTGVVLRNHNRLTRLWVPYERNATMPMDWRSIRERYHYNFLPLYDSFSRREMERWA